MDEHDLIVGLKEEKAESHKRTPKKRVVKKDVEEVAKGDKKIEPPLNSIICTTWIICSSNKRQ